MSAKRAGAGKRRRIPDGTTRQGSSSALRSRGERVRWLALLLVAAGVAAYANSFTVPFVFDDHSTIVENPYIRHLWPLKTALSGPIQSAVAGRPVISLSLAINYALGGLDPAGFHAWNLGVHLLCGLLVFGIIRRTLEIGSTGSTGSTGSKGSTGAMRNSSANPTHPSNSSHSSNSSHASNSSNPSNLLAVACALLWLAHPLHTEVIDYVTQRTESMMGLFYLLTLYAAIRAMSAGEHAWRWNGVAITACALGMASKESMVTAPVMVLLYDAVFGAGSVRGALGARWRLYAGLAATWLILAALIFSGPRSHSAGFSSGVTPWTYLLNQPAMLVRYLTLAFWPHGLVLDYGVPQALALKNALPYALVIIALFGATCAAWFKRPKLAFLGTWFFVTLAPSSSFIPIATEVGAERRMYLPLIAIVVLSVIGGWQLLARLPSLADSRRRDQIGAACLAVMYFALAALTLQRSSEYHSRTGIWQTVLDRRPNGRAHYNLAIELKEQGNRPDAIRHYQLALTDAPEAHYAVGFELDADGNHAEAIQHYREYIRLRPDDINVIRAYILLGRALRIEGQLEPAAEAFRQAIQRNPPNVDAHAGLAGVLLQQERFDEAIQEYREYVRLQPNDPAAHSGLGIALVGREREAEAVEEFARAVELEPNDAPARYNLGNALASTGRLDEAVSQYRRGLALDPTSAQIKEALSLALAARGQSDESLAARKNRSR